MSVCFEFFRNRVCIWFDIKNFLLCYIILVGDVNMVNCVYIIGLLVIFYLLFKMFVVLFNLFNNLIKYIEFNVNINKWKLLVISVKLFIIKNVIN